MNTSIFDFFDRVYCIHLPNPERLNLIKQQFQSVGIKDVQYIHADPPDKNFKMSHFIRSAPMEFGCNLSQMKAIVHAIADQAERPVFFEDDIIFDKNTKQILPTALKQLPDDWDMLYMGGHPREHCTRYSSHLIKVKRFSFGDAYCITKPALIKFYDFWSNRISKQKAQYDCILGDFAATQNTYCVYPIICQQRPGHSQISGEYEDKSYLINSRWKRWLRT